MGRGILERYSRRVLEQLEAINSLKSSTAWVLCFCLVLIGVGVRLSPIFDIDGRLFWQFMSEDGYLMQTVARNFALGLGLSTAEGTIPTNGVQPLATFIFAALHFLSGGSKTDSIVLVTLVSTVLATASAIFVYMTMRRLLTPSLHAETLSLAAAALWIAAPSNLAHSMNGLETGLYQLTLLVTVWWYLKTVGDSDNALSWAQRFILGSLLGICFLARNDAVFFIGALLLAHLSLGQGATGRQHRFVDCIVAGMTSIVIASPWLINNYLLFGSIVPVSGIAQSYKAVFGDNADILLANLLQSFVPYVLIPARFEPLLLVNIGAMAALILLAVSAWFIVARRSVTNRRIFMATAIFTICLCGYYGLFFGAKHFIPRYLSALSPLLWLFAAGAGIMVISATSRLVLNMRVVTSGALMLAVISSGGFSAYKYATGDQHMHKQVVRWVNENLQESIWVGAIQTGTLGFFHDRTINLDGKVNPAALKAKIEKGSVLDYVTASKIDYIVDWKGLTIWDDPSISEAFSKNFTVIVDDPIQNLSVLKRCTAVSPANEADVVC